MTCQASFKLGSVGLRRSSLWSSGWYWTYSSGRDGLEFIILLPQCPKCWDSGHVSSHSVELFKSKKIWNCCCVLTDRGSLWASHGSSSPANLTALCEKSQDSGDVKTEVTEIFNSARLKPRIVKTLKSMSFYILLAYQSERIVCKDVSSKPLSARVDSTQMPNFLLCGFFFVNICVCACVCMCACTHRHVYVTWDTREGQKMAFEGWLPPSMDPGDQESGCPAWHQALHHCIISPATSFVF